MLAAAGVVATAGLGVMLTGRAGDVSAALAGVPLGAVVLLAVMQAATYLCRVSAWGAALKAGSAPLSAHHVRGASGISFAITLVLPGYAGAAARVGLLRRLGRDSDVGIAQLAMIDVLALATEAVFLALIAIPVLLIFAPSLWWAPLAAIAVGAAVFALARPLRGRLARCSASRTLALFGDRRSLMAFAVPLLAVVLISPLRFWVALGVLGLDASLGMALVAFIVVSTVGALPVGGTQAGIGGLGVVFASHGTEVVLAAGVVLAATAALGAILYLIAITLLWAADLFRVPEPLPAPA